MPECSHCHRQTVVALAVGLLAGAVFAVADDASPETAITRSVKRTDEGWFVHTLESEYQSGPTQIRVLLPNDVEPGKRYPVLYVLPVEANTEHRYGDGLAEVKRCNIPTRYGVICVAPTFAQLPWYADHPTDKGIRQESYVLKTVVPFVEQNYPALAERRGRWLLGFSKSGWGAWSLLARNPDVFDRAAAWDAPLEMPRFEMFGAGPIFGTQEHFETYRVLPALKACTKLHDKPRLVLTGYDNFRDQHESAHQKLTEWKIPHIYRDGPKRKHTWDSGWVEESVAALAEISKEQ